MPSKTSLTLPPIDPVKQLRAELRKLIPRTAGNVQATAKISMTGPKSGKQYGIHRASAPGEAPAIDEGALYNSIEIEEVNDLTWRVFVGSEEGIWMEFGTTRIAPRPFLGPAVEKNRRAFEAAIKALIS